jgi:acetyl-CoA synthetase
VTHDVVWRPDPATVGDTNVGRFMAAHGIDAFEDLVRRSIDEPEWFWDAVVQFLGLPFTTPYSKVVDTSDGVPWARWFVDGRLNIAGACVDRWATATPEAPAVVWEGEDGEVRTWDYRELRAQVDTVAALLAARGVGEGDAVGIFLPMVPEVVAAFFAVAKLGAVSLPIFSGYGAEAIAVRLDDAEAKALITADGFFRRGTAVAMLATAMEAADLVPSVETIVVVPRLGNGADATDLRQVLFPGVVDEAFETRAVDSEHPLLIAYTSGTTGRPKGSVHVHGGFLAKIAEEVAFQFDCRPGDRLFWFADFGWIMGPLEIVGALASGATVCLYEGAPDHPRPDRVWEYVERHQVTILGISPTLIRALMPHGDEPVRQHDLGAVRILGSTGEPWNEGPYRWYFEVVGGGRCPVINISGGTEIAACFLSPHPVHDIRVMSLGGPALGMAVDVFDENGQPLRDAVGELVCTKPWPGMTRGLYRDPERYLEVYWSRWPNVWLHGDWASIEDGQWFLHGRSDDTIKLAGKRLGPAEVESALVSHPAVVEAAAIGVPDEVKGEQLWCYCVLAPGVDASDDLRQDIAGVVVERLGRSFKPAAVRFVAGLPKTRSAKVLRRAIRATVLGTDPGDLSSLEDKGTIEAVRRAQ